MLKSHAMRGFFLPELSDSNFGFCGRPLRALPQKPKLESLNSGQKKPRMAWLFNVAPS
jgi:hypothetical protein